MVSASVRLVVRNVLIVVAVVICLYLIYLLRTPLGWIFVASFLAVAVSGPVTALSRHMSRGLAIAAVYLGILLVPVAIGALLVPSLVSQSEELVGNVPGYSQDVQEFVQESERLRELDEKYDITSKLQEEADKLPGRVGDAAKILGDLGVGFVNSVFALVNILILSVFMVGGGPRWVRGVLRLQPPERAARLERVLGRIRNAIGNYVGGAMLQAFIAAVTAYVVLWILGVPFKGALALLVFFFDLLPLVGATIGAVLVGVVTLFTDFPTATIVWTIFAIVYQQVENNVIQPRIQQRAVALEPFLVLVAVLFGGTLLGVVGALLAVPVAASLQIAVKEWWAYREEVRHGDALEFASATPAPAPGPAPGGAQPPS